NSPRQIQPPRLRLRTQSRRTFSTGRGASSPAQNSSSFEIRPTTQLQAPHPPRGPCPLPFRRQVPVISRSPIPEWISDSACATKRSKGLPQWIARPLYPLTRNQTAAAWLSVRQLESRIAPRAPPCLRISAPRFFRRCLVR